MIITSESEVCSPLQSISIFCQLFIKYLLGHWSIILLLQGDNLLEDTSVTNIE